jgi:predicted DNA-binding protein
MPKAKITFFIEPDMWDKLKTLSSITRVKQADYIREGIEIVFEKYKGEFKKAKKKGGE